MKDDNLHYVSTIPHNFIRGITQEERKENIFNNILCSFLIQVCLTRMICVNL